MPGKKIAVVTGGNKGIGYAIVKGLCEKFDGDVFLTSRDVGRGIEAVKSLKQLGFHPKYHQLEVTDEASIKKFRDFVKREYEGIDILVNNAGIAIHPDSDIDIPVLEEVKETLRVNYFGIRKVCDLLFPLLRPHARVVNLTSSVGHLSYIPGQQLRDKLSAPTLTETELDALMLEFMRSVKENKNEENGWPSKPMCAYLVSKVAVSALSIIQQRKFLEDTTRPDIIVNSVHPGYVDTDLTQHKGPLTIEEGAVAPLFAALIPKNASGPKGEFIWGTTEVVDWAHGTTPSLH